MKEIVRIQIIMKNICKISKEKLVLHQFLLTKIILTSLKGCEKRFKVNFTKHINNVNSDFN